MIDPKELRIGNRINYNLPEQNRCKAYDGTFNEEFARYLFDVRDEWQYLEPIPLTPEILDKCGFKNGRLNIDITAVRPLYLQSGNSGTVVFYWGEYNSQPSPYSIHYEYLHQLQNLYFALTGEELKIKL